MASEGDAGLLTYAEAAQRLGVRVGTLHALVSEKRVPHVRVGPRFVRFVAGDLDAWISARKVAPRSDAPAEREGGR